MTLTTHAVVGATLATLIPTHPVLGFVVGFGSHFVLDAIPHWGYSIDKMKRGEGNPLDGELIIDKNSFKDLLKIGIDGLLGLLLPFLIFSGIFHQQFYLAIFMGAIGGMVPDALQFCYFKWKHEPLVSLERFHIWIHSKASLNLVPTPSVPDTNTGSL